jgi:hypothetical protein
MLLATCHRARAPYRGRMKLAALAVITLAAIGTTARADQPGALQLGLGVGVPGLPTGGELIADVAWRPSPDTPLRVHVMWTDGQAEMEDYADVDFAQYRVGAQVAGCIGGVVACAIADLDIGVLRAKAPDFVGGQAVDDPVRTGFLIAGRGGFELGNRDLRFRLMLDLAKAQSGRFTAIDGWGDPVSFGFVGAIDAEVLASF